MSGAKLCAVLADLGFNAGGGGGDHLLDPDSFEWPFQYEEVRPVLDWICSTLRPSNVLSTSELTQYDQFLHEGKLLEGEDLDSAFDSILAFSSRGDNQEAVFGAEERVIDIREAKLAYTAEVVELQKQLRRQQSQFDLLARQVSTLIQGRRARMAATSAINGQLMALDEKLSARNLEMNASLGKIASTAQELAHYHSGVEDGIYLAYSDFHSYLANNSVCTKELNQWFSKQFEKGPLRLVAEEGKSKCSWVSLDDITNCLIRVSGDTEKSHHHNRIAELQRLRSMRRHSELSGEVSNLRHKVQKLLAETIPRLCSELAQLQDTYILQGDYDLKVMRQEYYINQQKAFINHLVNQLARHRFLRIACQLESGTMLGAYSLLKVIESELQDYFSMTTSRVGHCLSMVQIASEVREHGAVDDRDTFLHGVRDLLSIHSSSQGALPTYVSAHGLVQQIAGLQTDLQSLQLELETVLPEDRRRCENELCTLIQSLEQLLFASSKTAELTPRNLMRALDEMEKVNSQLSACVEEVTEAHRQKAEIVKHHPREVGRERQVFVDFFCNPDRLRNQVRELTSRVKALQE